MTGSPVGSDAGALQRISVLGAGSWGTAFGKVLADAGRQVTIWARREEVAHDIAHAHRNARYLGEVRLPSALTATADLDRAVAGADAVVLAVPSQSLRENLQLFREVIPAGVPVVSLVKGVEIGTGMRMSELITAVGRIAPERVVVLTGPNLAPEIAAGRPTASVLACVEHRTAARVQTACGTSYFRPYTITDVVGAEIAGTGKNVIALACGMADGLQLGLNTAATLIARGLNELTRLAECLGANPSTMAGLAGLGDLVATCSSPLSRNRTLGARLAAGDGLEAASAASGGQVAEGVGSCRSVRDLAHRHGVDMPITEGVYQVCYRDLPPSDMIAHLMSGPYTPE